VHQVSIEKSDSASALLRVVTICLTGVAIAMVAAPAVVHAATVAPVHVFRGQNGGGVYPVGALTEGSDGHLYGATYFGGPYDSGTIFRLTSDGAFETLTGFGLLAGSHPTGSLVEGSDGNFYGVTQWGGQHDGGTIFRMTPNGLMTVLHSFKASTWGGSPKSGLTQSSDGAFYGILSENGLAGPAHMYRITEDGEYSLVGAMSPECEGYDRLVDGSDGHFYGVTTSGDASCIFRANKKGATTVLYRFEYGEYPAGITVGSDGNIYGTMSRLGCSSVYRFTPAREFTTIYQFICLYYNYPGQGLVEGSDGYFHGTIDIIFRDQVIGSVYRVAPDGRFEQTRMPSRTGYSMGQLIQASDGNFYGAAGLGGRFDKGTLVRVEEPPARQ
jgi:uncharacterized repeat protein (TIGR03803 family)